MKTEPENFVIVDGANLRAAMKIVSSVVERRSTIPILSYARLTIEGKHLIIEGTNLDIWAKIKIDPINWSGNWSTMINVETIRAIARQSGAAPIKIEQTGEDAVRVTLDDGSATYDLQTLPPADFPEPPFEVGALIERFTNGMFPEILAKVRACISTEETRYYLNGVSWQMTENGRRIIATDGHRLTMCKYSTEPTETMGCIIPARTVDLIISNFPRSDLSIFKSDAPGKGIIVTTESVAIFSKLIDGTYPDTDRVVPKSDDIRHVFQFQRDEFLTAIDRASAVGGSSGFKPAIKLNETDGKVCIGKKNQDQGSALVVTSAKWPTGDKKGKPEPFGFNGKYIRQIISGCQGPVEMRMSGPGMPFVFTDADSTVTRILMPMRV